MSLNTNNRQDDGASLVNILAVVGNSQESHGLSRERFDKLLEARTFKTNSEIDDYADEHNLLAADVWQCFAEYKDDYLIKQSIGTPCEGCKYVTQIGGLTPPCYECCRNKTDFYEERK